MERKSGFKINSESINEDFFKRNKKNKVALKRKQVIGTIIAMTGMVAAFGMAAEVSERMAKEDVRVEAEENSNKDLTYAGSTNLEVPLVGLGAYDNVSRESISLDEVNSLNIIINDNKCSISFFDDVCQKLQDDGIKFTETGNCENINVNNSVVISLDQLYMSGPGMLVFTPYDNDRLGDSDALAVAMEAGFKNNGLETDDICAGKIGYRESIKGDIQTRVPTSTEEAIGTDKNTSFVTVSFGTDNKDAAVVADSIENALARFVYYQKEKTSDEDLIYRVAGGDLMENIETRFYGSSAREIDYYNNLEFDANNIYADTTLRNPDIANKKAFDESREIKLDIEKAHKY